MLLPQQQRDASGRIKFTDSAGGAAPARVVNGIAVDATGRILGDTSAVSGSTANGGLARDANGNLFITGTPAGTDVFQMGYRFSVTGALVVGIETVPTIFCNGDSFAANGSLCITEV